MLWRVPGREQDQFVDVQRDATVADVARAVGAGMRSVEHIKRYTTIGTAHDQGKTSGVIASGITAELLGRAHRSSWAPRHFGRPTRPSRSRRWPGATVARCSIRSALRRCTTGMSRRARCSRTSGSGSVRVITLRPGEDMDAAVLRECAAVAWRCRHTRRLHTRQDRRARAATPPSCWTCIYTNLMSSLKVGLDPATA